MLVELILGASKNIFDYDSKAVKKRLETYANMKVKADFEDMSGNPRVIIVRKEINKYLCKHIAEEELKAFREDGTNCFGIFGYWGAIRTLNYLDEKRERNFLK